MIVSVPPPVPALGLYPAVYVVRDVAETDRKLAALLAGIEAVAERWVLDTSALCKVLAAWAAVDALLGARLELAREEAAHYIEMWWVESWPGTAPPQWPAGFDDDDSQDSAGEVAA